MSSDRVILQTARASKIATAMPINNGEIDVQSNNVLLAIEGRPNVQHEQSNMTNPHQRAAALTYISCTTTHKSQIVSAVSSALSYADSSYIYLSMTPSAKQRYMTWYSTSLANWNTLKKHYQNIKTALNSKSISFNCGCTQSNTYAYVYANSPYVIYLCDAFWLAPTTGTDSKAGTLVHEISHFTVVAGTQDYAYGQAACKSLAIRNPTQAIQNADSHEYFAENNPALK